MGKKTYIGLAVFMIGFYLFTSGFILEVSKDETLNQVNIPYSIALSNKRVEITGIFTDDDVACAEWLAYESDVNVPIYLDYCGLSIMLEYVYNRGYIIDDPQGEGHYYIFLRTWNNESGKMVHGYNAGLRDYKPIPDVENLNVVFKQGNAVIYEVNNA